MSATTQLQMAPQTALVQVNQNPNHSVITSAVATTAQNNQDSNMSTGSSHSDKEVERDVVTQAIINNTPEKLPRQQSERKRKRKPTEDNGNGPGGPRVVGSGVLNVNDLGIRDGIHNNKGQRVSLAAGIGADKKINEYFHSKHGSNSTRLAGAKSPSPQQLTGTFPMHPPSPQPHGHQLNVNNQVQDYMTFKPRSTNNIVSSAQSALPPPPGLSSQQQSPVGNHQVASVGNNLLPLSNVVSVQQSLSAVGPPGTSVTTQQQQQQQQQSSSPQQNLPIIHHNQNNLPQSHSLSVLSMVSKAVQTDLTLVNMQDRDAEGETTKTKIDDMTRVSDEQKSQIAAHQKVIEQQKSHINKCIDVVKKLLKQKSNIEKKEARQKCMQNRLRLGQFVTQRVGATFQENWTDGYAFQELARRQEEITSEREEIDKQKKSLVKKRPTNTESGRKRNSSTTTASPASTSTTTNLHNGGDATFLKPEPVASSSTFTLQEYYECDEILKLRHNALKKEDADLQLEMEKLERERNLHIRELKRIHNEDQVNVWLLNSVFTSSASWTDFYSTFSSLIAVSIQQPSGSERPLSLTHAVG